VPRQPLGLALRGGLPGPRFALASLELRQRFPRRGQLRLHRRQRFCRVVVR